jgi:uncharacterized protein (DUF2236 family)
MYRDTTKTGKNVQRHYKDKQKCTETLQMQAKMYRDTTKTRKNVQMYFKDKKTKMHRDRDITKTIIKERDITKTNNDNMPWFRQTFKYNYSEITQKYQIVRYAFRIN